MQSTTEIKYVFWLGTVMMLLLAGVLLFLAVFYQNRVFKMRQKETEAMLRVALDTEKRERKRISADLHDGVSGDLSAIRNFLTVLQKTEKNEQNLEIYADIQNSVEAALENTRTVSYRLMPPLLETYGFVTALKDYFDRIAITSSIKFNVHYTAEPQFSNDLAYDVFRVMQEFVTNLIKYGKATTFTVAIEILDEIYTLAIIDDGAQYDYQGLLQVSKGSGLRNISSRIKSMKAEMKQQPAEIGNHFIIEIKK